MVEKERGMVEEAIAILKDIQKNRKTRWKDRIFRFQKKGLCGSYEKVSSCLFTNYNL